MLPNSFTEFSTNGQVNIWHCKNRKSGKELTLQVSFQPEVHFQVKEDPKMRLNLVRNTVLSVLPDAFLHGA